MQLGCACGGVSGQEALLTNQSNKSEMIADEEMEGLQTSTSQKLPDAAAALFSNPNFISFNAGDETKKQTKAKKSSSSPKDDDSASKKGKKK